ncbi:exopolysaccharide biosynthesis protein [Rickettsiella endosymbiont of Xylota segnis]|uniref:exopolysaccharide biosynthesis protein n=1 Tax=Rickettsiella endosymbiont of Xylota segnis TaxID=3066238 RepID=UPI0030CB241E
MHKTYKHSSQILIEIARNKHLKNKDLSFAYLLQLMGKRAFGMGLLLFSLPSALPFSTIPGVAFVFSLPIVLFSLQMMYEKTTLWLPKIIANRTINHKNLSKIIHATVPYLRKIERFLKPRWPFMTSRAMEVSNGITIFCLALLLILPIPLSNFIFALLIIIFSLGIIEKDGIFITLAYVSTLSYLAFVSTFILSAIKIIF